MRFPFTFYKRTAKSYFQFLHILYPFSSVSGCIWSLNAIFYNCISKHFLLFLCLLWKHYEKERTTKTKTWCRFWLCIIWTNFRAYCINTQNNTLKFTENIQKNMPNRMSKYGVLWRGDRILKGTKMCFHKRNFIQTHFA